MLLRCFSNVRGLAVQGLLGFILFVLVVLGGLLYTFGTVVPPGYVGIRQINFGPGQGFADDGLYPGYHWTVPFYSRVHLVPRKIQVLHLDRDRALHPDSLGTLEIQTTDGATVDVDFSILRSFFASPGEEDGAHHGGPADLIKNIGISADKWDNHLLRVASDSLRRSLGKLSTSEFYDPHLRESGVQEAFLHMREPLARFGTKIEAVLLRRYTYTSERIDNAIFQKNLQEQEERLNTAGSKLAEARARLERVEAEWDAKIQTLRVEGENKSRVVRSEGDLYEAGTKAQGDLELARAAADIDRLRAGALAQSDASRLYVARELAPLLTSLKGGVVTNLDPYDLDAWMKKFGIESKP